MDSSGDCKNINTVLGIVVKFNTSVLEKPVPQPTLSCQSIKQYSLR